MEERLHQRVVGQDEAIVAVSNAVRRSRSGMQDPNRPIGSFIFLGPTGVENRVGSRPGGVPFDDQNAMVRIDMSVQERRIRSADCLARLRVTWATKKAVN